VAVIIIIKHIAITTIITITAIIAIKISIAKAVVERLQSGGR
jgi:hypothetical protein